MDPNYLLNALALAQQRRGFCAPNPAVGAVIVDTHGKIVGSGHHYGAGFPHAEIEALKSLQDSAAASTLYVTLEPCCHFGRTPPCTDAILKAGIKHVVYGYQDPNPLVAGKGAAQLREQGVRCDLVSLPEIAQFYQSYQHWQRYRTPFMTAKLAMSLDGKIAGPAGERVQLTGPELQRLTHERRLASDAILTTAKTILQDDPQLNVRLDGQVIAKPIYLIDRQLRLPLTAQIVNTAQSVTIFHAHSASQSTKHELLKLGLRCIALDETPNGLDLDQVLAHIGQEGMHDVWVEAGGTFFSSLLHENRVQRLLIYLAPRWLVHGQSAFTTPLSFEKLGFPITWRQFGNDVLGEMLFR